MGLTLSISLISIPAIAIIIIVPLILISWLIIIGAPFIFFVILPLVVAGLSIANIGLLTGGGAVMIHKKGEKNRKETVEETESPFETIPSNARKGVVISDGQSNILLSDPEPVENIYNDIILKDIDEESIKKIEQIFNDAKTSNEIDYLEKENVNCKKEDYEELKLNKSTFFNIKNNIFGKIYFKLHLGNKISAWSIRKHLLTCPLCQSQLDILRRVVPPSKNNSWWKTIPKMPRKILTTYFDFPWEKINRVIFTEEEFREREKIFEEKSKGFKNNSNEKNYF